MKNMNFYPLAQVITIGLINGILFFAQKKVIDDQSYLLISAITIITLWEKISYSSKY